MIDLIATKKVKYNGVYRTPGEKFSATPKHSKLLIIVGKAMIDPAAERGETPKFQEAARTELIENVIVAPVQARTTSARGGSRRSKAAAAQETMLETQAEAKKEGTTAQAQEPTEPTSVAGHGFDE